MKKFKSFVSAFTGFKKKPSEPEDDAQPPSSNENSVHSVAVTDRNNQTYIDDNNDPEPEPPSTSNEAVQSLADRSIKVTFPKSGDTVDHERDIQNLLHELPGIVNVCPSHKITLYCILLRLLSMILSCIQIGIKGRKAVILFSSIAICQENTIKIRDTLGSGYKVS